MVVLFQFLLSMFNVNAQHSHLTDWSTDSKAFRSYQAGPRRFSALDQKEQPLPSQKIFDGSELKRKLSQLSGALPIIYDGKEVFIKERRSAEGKKLARAYLAHLLMKAGYEVSEQKYSSTGTNLIAEKEGKDSSAVVIVSAHMDSVGNAGADDDGSGTITAVTIMESLAKVDLKYSLRFVAFDEEEDGLVGSRAYVKSLKKMNQDILGVFNFEMTAYNKRKDGAFHVIDCDREDSVLLTKAIVKAKEDLQLPLQRTKACTDRSDHASFWDAEIPAIVISQNFFGGDSNPCYHRSCDQVSDALNFDYMSNITEAGSLAIQRLVSDSAKRK